MRTYNIGRSKDCDVIFQDDSVSRKHAEVVITHAGKIFVTDCGSSQGTFLAKNGEWEKLTQKFVSESDVLLLGRFQVTVNQLVNDIKQGNLSTDKNVGNNTTNNTTNDRLPAGDVERDPTTGEPIVSKGAK